MTKGGAGRRRAVLDGVDFVITFSDDVVGDSQHGSLVANEENSNLFASKLNLRTLNDEV